MDSEEKKQRGERGCGKDWQPLHLQAESMAEAKALLRATGRWKVARRSQGDGKRSLVFNCTEHINCPVQRRVVLAKDNQFHIYETVPHLCPHNMTVNTKKRKNSAMDVAQEKELVCDIWKGVRPAGSRLSMTLTKEAELMEAGEDPTDFKRPDEEGGGLIGAHSTPSTVY